MSIFFTSDQHFDHANVIKYCSRPFNSVEEMNEELIARHNAIVSHNDTVFHLGDFSMSIQGVEKYLPRLNGTKILIAGNHDLCHPAHKKGKKDLTTWTNRYIDLGFVNIQNEMTLGASKELGLPELLLSHFPYKQAEDNEYGLKFMEYRPEPSATILLHGHVHEKWLIKGNGINVGVDVNDFMPVSIERLKELITLI